MRDTCIHCGAPLGGDDAAADEAGFGLCADCLPLFVTGAGVPVQQFLDSLPEPVFLVDKDACIVGANQGAQKLVSWNPDVDAPELGGEVFQCVHAQLPGGCGQTVHCKACTIRNSVTHTGATGESLSSVPAYMDLGDIARSTKTRFLISTEKIGRFILLLIEDIASADEEPVAE